MLTPITNERNATIAGSAKLTSSVRGALASLSLSMLMPSLDTSIANAGLPMLARAFTASFQEVQWIVLAYLLAITTVIVSVGRVGDIIGRRQLQPDLPRLGGMLHHCYAAARPRCGY